jgi:methylmalonyl-CoA mutase cobalamin-binding subunit
LCDGLRAEIQNLDGLAVIVGTPSGPHHEIGALLAAAAAAAQGLRVTYLGPDLPASSIAEAAGLTGARAVALSLIYPADDFGLEAELRSLRSLLPAGVTLIIGGQAARLGDWEDLSPARVARFSATNRNGRSRRSHVG